MKSIFRARKSSVKKAKMSKEDSDAQPQYGGLWRSGSSNL